jgi:hypothetical protein
MGLESIPVPVATRATNKTSPPGKKSDFSPTVILSPTLALEAAVTDCFADRFLILLCSRSKFRPSCS